MFWKLYRTRAISQFYIDEVTFAYLLSKGYLRENAKKKGDAYTNRLVFYGQDMDLALSFGEVEVLYTMEDGTKNFIFMKDVYDFNKGSRKWYFEMLTTAGRIFPGQPFHIYFPAPPKNMCY